MIDAVPTYYKDIEVGTKHQYLRYKKPGDKYGKYYVKCNELVKHPDGTICHCAMEEMRENHFKKWIQNKRHICTPGEVASQQTIDQYYQNVPATGLTPISLGDIYEQLATFTGRFNLVLNTFSSPEFTKLVKTIIMYTADSMILKFPQLYNVNINVDKLASQIYQPISTDKLRQTMIQIANSIHVAKVDEFAKLACTCVAIDEGKTQQFHNLDFSLTNPLQSKRPYPVESIQMNGGTSEDYIHSLTQGFNRIFIRDVKISSVVCDGNKAQLKCFQKGWNQSFYNSNDPRLFKILFIPCLCHRIHNCYQYMTTKDVALGEIVKHIHEISARCRIHVEDVGALCPKHVSTRWIYDYNICMFIIKYQDKISRYTRIDIENIKFLRDCLAILKKLISTFESDKTKISDCYVWLCKGIEALQYLSSSNNNPFAGILSRSLLNYTLGSDFGGLWCLAFAFTPKGRYYFNQKFVHGAQINESPAINSFDITNVTFVNPVEDIQSIYMDSIFEEGSTEVSLDMVEEGSIRQVTATIDPPMLDLADVTSSSNQPVNHFVAARQYLKSILEQFRIPGQTITDIITLFNTYINSDNDIFSDDMIQERQEYCWEEISHRDGNVSIFADIALHVISASPSEATCERTIKDQRLILNLKRLRSHKILLDSREILMATK